jgi:(E)-4-hydroxy-3-methylbut-2-enyl-diphosphate synthase
MVNVPTENVGGAVAQIRALADGGCDLVRLAVTTLADVTKLAEIGKILRRDGPPIPLIADVHFSPTIAEACLEVADKVRINAGNFSDGMGRMEQFSEEKFAEGREKLRDRLGRFFLRCIELGKPVRIGINHGSLAPRIAYKFGNTAFAMWKSAEECLEVAAMVNFRSLVLSFKASDAAKMVAANRLACDEMDKRGWNFPIHLGVTEAGGGSYARIKSAIGIGTLLLDGIGDTVRVSLTEDPINELDVAKNILQACGLSRHGVEIVACPSCGRTSYDIQAVLSAVEARLAPLPAAKHLKIAIMGCAINGLGEAGDADFALVGAPNGSLSIYAAGHRIARNIAADRACDELVRLCHCPPEA